MQSQSHNILVSFSCFLCAQFYLLVIECLPFSIGSHYSIKNTVGEVLQHCWTLFLNLLHVQDFHCEWNCMWSVHVHGSAHTGRRRSASTTFQVFHYHAIKHFWPPLKHFWPPLINNSSYEYSGRPRTCASYSTQLYSSGSVHHAMRLFLHLNRRPTENGREYCKVAEVGAFASTFVG